MERNTKLCSQPSPRTGGIRTAVLIPWLLVLAAVCGLCLAMYQIRVLKQDVSLLETQLQTTEAALQTAENSVSRESNPPTDILEKAKQYDHICRSLENSTIGYSSYNFRSYDSIILLNQSERNRTFTLVSHWDEECHITASYSSPHATVSFDEASWDTSTTLTVHPNSPGATVVTFSNSVNAKQFKILIIVTE